MPVMTLPGPSSVLAALTLAALPTDRFFFEGFLPAKEAARRTRLGELARIEASLVLFESGHRIREALADLADILGPRPAAICRELTKLHEDVRRGSLAELAAAAADLETRGEFVVVVGPPEREAMPQAELDDILRLALRRGSVKDAVAEGVELSGRPKREVYTRALELVEQATRDGNEEARGGEN
jgi:16S rRNA (cytidine1402-2'-O)-methyltransferase